VLHLIEQLTMTGSRGRLAMATDRPCATDAIESRGGIVNRFDQGDVEHSARLEREAHVSSKNFDTQRERRM